MDGESTSPSQGRGAVLLQGPSGQQFLHPPCAGRGFSAPWSIRRGLLVCLIHIQTAQKSIVCPFEKLTEHNPLIGFPWHKWLRWNSLGNVHHLATWTCPKYMTALKSSCWKETGAETADWAIDLNPDGASWGNQRQIVKLLPTPTGTEMSIPRRFPLTEF